MLLSTTLVRLDRPCYMNKLHIFSLHSMITKSQKGDNESSFSSDAHHSFFLCVLTVQDVHSFES